MIHTVYRLKTEEVVVKWTGKLTCHESCEVCCMRLKNFAKKRTKFVIFAIIVAHFTIVTDQSAGFVFLRLATTPFSVVWVNGFPGYPIPIILVIAPLHLQSNPSFIRWGCTHTFWDLRYDLVEFFVCRNGGQVNVFVAAQTFASRSRINPCRVSLYPYVSLSFHDEDFVARSPA